MTAVAGVTLQVSNDTYLTSNVFDLFSLKNHVVVITGGARGIGIALAFAVAEAGGLVAIVDALEKPHEHYEKLQEICAKAMFYQSDVTDYGKLKETFDHVVADFGRIDGM
jgi:sorbose reductase